MAAPPASGAVRGVLAASAALALAGCGQHVAGVAVPNARPTISLSAAPAPLSDVSYIVRLRWTGLDPDGQIVSWQYAVDPGPGPDTTWTAAAGREVTLTFPSTEPPDPLPPPGQTVVARDQHVFVLRAIDNEGLASEPAQRAFTSRTVVPYTLIRQPRPSILTVATLPAVDFRWEGFDQDGGGAAPVAYRYRLVTADAVNPENPDFVSAGRIQEFFGGEAAAGFAGWDSTGGDTTSLSLEGLTVDRTYLFAVSARDVAGAVETRFVPSWNVLQFRPTFNRTGPRITLFNSYFRRTLTGGVSQAASRIIPLEVPAGSSVTMNWFAEASTGAQIAGYRWALDLADRQIADETPRRDETDITHWSNWSLDETAATIGPFRGSPDGPEIHYLYVMARDNVGFQSLFTLELRVIAMGGQRELLLVDDRYGPLIGASGAFPSEAEEDSFHCAVGGRPDVLTGGTSVAGAFAGTSYDTLDNRAWRSIPGNGDGIALSALAPYKAVAWYTDVASASAGSGTSNNPPAIALRTMNLADHLNVLAAYLRMGGKLFLFGEGAPVAIAGGYYASIGRLPPTFPYTSSNVLRAGSFLYDYLHMRSTLNIAGVSTQRLRGAIPYLPEYAGPVTATDRSHDPRIGPGAARTAERWAGLPRLTIASYRGANADPALRAVNQTWWVASPLRVTEGGASVLDTLYLFQSQTLDFTGGTGDGQPNAFHWHGTGHGEVVWLGFPLYYFEPDQARALVQRVVHVFGLAPPGAVRTPGAGSVRAPAGPAR